MINQHVSTQNSRCHSGNATKKCSVYVQVISDSEGSMYNILIDIHRFFLFYSACQGE